MLRLILLLPLTCGQVWSPKGNSLDDFLAPNRGGFLDRRSFPTPRPFTTLPIHPLALNLPLTRPPLTSLVDSNRIHPPLANSQDSPPRQVSLQETQSLQSLARRDVPSRQIPRQLFTPHRQPPAQAPPLQNSGYQTKPAGQFGRGDSFVVPPKKGVGYPVGPKQGYAARPGKNVIPQPTPYAPPPPTPRPLPPHQPAVPYSTSMGLCSFERGCWDHRSNQAVSGSYPFDRRTPFTCDECVSLCLQKSKDPAPYRCKAAVFDFKWRSCDLFAVTIFPNTIARYTGRDLFLPLGNCTRTGPSGPTTPGPEYAARETKESSLPKRPPMPRGEGCEAGKEQRFIKIPDSKLAALGGEKLRGVSLADCIETCSRNENFLTLERLECESFNFEPRGGGECTISPNSSPQILQRRGDLDLTTQVGASFYEKICIEESAGSRCSGEIVREPGRILVGYAVEVVFAVDFDECLAFCVDSVKRLGFPCVSGMFYFDEDDKRENCILNTESADSQPELLVDEDSDPVDYFQLTCSQRLRLR